MRTRLVVWHGRVQEIPCGTKDTPHVFAYRGEIPCTGPRVCIYCGEHE